jgi:hypothetical protein
LFEGFQELAEEDGGWFVDEEVDVLGHQDVGVDSGLVTCSCLFEDEFDCGFGVGVFEVRETVVATEGDEVEGLGLLVPLQTVGHGVIVLGFWGGGETHSSR